MQCEAMHRALAPVGNLVSEWLGNMVGAYIATLMDPPDKNTNNTKNLGGPSDWVNPAMLSR